MQRLWLRALLTSTLLCGAVLVLGLFHRGFSGTLWIFWLPGMAAVSYSLGAVVKGGFDAELHPGSASLVVLVDLIFWWLVIYLLLRLWHSWQSRRQVR